MILPCFLIICLALCTNGLKLHEEMTKDEVYSTFGVPHHEADSIEYEVTSLHHNEHPDNEGQKVRRARSTLQFAAFERSYSLDLSQNDVLVGSETPLLLASLGRDGRLQYTRQQFPMPNNMKLYHDIEKRAAIATFTNEYNQTQMVGTIGHDLAVKPIPARLRKEGYSNEHVLYKRSAQVSYNPSSNYYQPARPQEYYPGLPNTQQQSLPYTDIMYFKILVAIDYDTYEKHGKNINELSKYMAAFWNSVDLIYRDLSEPQVRLNIAGLIVPQTRDSAPHFQKASIPDDDSLNGGTILTELQKIFVKQTPLDRSAFDVTVVMSSRLLATVYKGEIDSIAGLANQASVCQTSGFALAKDHGNFLGVTTAAHELGHTLSAIHDEYTNDPEGPCPGSDGYIMRSSEILGKNATRWSPCSQRAIRKYLMSRDAECMRTKPNVGTPYPRILAGQILSRAEQCKTYYGGKFFPDYSKVPESDCEVLWCKAETGLNSISKSWKIPADGTPCGEGSVCIKQKCVPESTANQQNPVVGTPHYPTANQHRPVVGTPYPTTRPGNAPSRDEQCATLAGQNYLSVKHKEDSCENLYCQNRNSPNENPLGIRSVAEGTPCGPGSICRNKQCVRDPTTGNQQGPVAGTSDQTNLPERVPSRDEQCSKWLGYIAVAYEDGNSRCDALSCRRKALGFGSNILHTGGIVADGTPCGPRSVCKRKRCLRI